MCCMFMLEKSKKYALPSGWWVQRMPQPVAVSWRRRITQCCPGVSKSRRQRMKGAGGGCLKAAVAEGASHTSRKESMRLYFCILDGLHSNLVLQINFIICIKKLECEHQCNSHTLASEPLHTLLYLLLSIPEQEQEGCNTEAFS